MSELEERARKVLEVARRGHGPSAADGVRVRAALGQRVAAEPRLLDVEPPAASRGKAILDKLLMALGVGGVAGFAAGFYVAQSMTATARVPDAVPSRAEVAVTADAGAPSSSAESSRSPRSPHGDAPLRSDVPSTPAPAPRPRAQPSAAPRVSPLKAELDGLRRAQELLHQGQAAFAIARLDELDGAAVGSALLEERAATRAIAQCRLEPSTRQPLAEFARRFPGSAHLDRVQSSCGAPTQSIAPAQIIAPAQTEPRGSRHE